VIPNIGGDVKVEQVKNLQAVHEDARVIGGEAPAGSSAGSSAPAEKPLAGRNDLCPCGSGKKFKKCHGV
jgi:preprotein translocase subunit SecA